MKLLSAGKFQPQVCDLWMQSEVLKEKRKNNNNNMSQLDLIMI
jgi:hypothetical protein